jgi:streptogramin lyase
MNYPYDIAIDGMDRVYTVEYGANRVQCFSSEGKLLSVWRQAERAAGGLNQPWGMDVTTDGRVYIADTYHYRVVKAGLLPGLEYSPAEVASNDRLLKKLKDGYPK